MSQRVTFSAPAAAAARRHSSAYAAVVAPGVEEVLGVVDHALALGAGVVDGVDDHRQVLLAGDPGDLLEVQAPTSCRRRCTPARRAGDQVAQRRIVLGREPAPAGHAERAHLRPLELDLGEQPEELGLLRVRAGEAGLDEADSEPVERLDDADLLGGRERHAVSPACRREGSCRRAVPGSRDAFRFGETSEVRRGLGRAAAEPLSGRGGANSLDCPEMRHRQPVTLLGCR